MEGPLLVLFPIAAYAVAIGITVLVVYLLDRH